MSGDRHTQFGFTFGPAEIERVAAVERGKRGTYRILNVRTPHRELNIYISPTGRSVRVFQRGEELHA